MIKNILIILLIIIIFITFPLHANSEGGEILKKYKDLYNQEKYDVIIKELPSIINGRLEGEMIGKALNILADSYFQLKKYTQAINYYGLSADSVNPYGEYYSELFWKISIRKGYNIPTQEVLHERKSHYTGWMGSYPSREETLNALLLKLFDDDNYNQKRQYLREIASYDNNNDWLTMLVKFCAGDITLEKLLNALPEKHKYTAYTYAGLSLELTGELEKARELYKKALLFKESHGMELLLAANRLGLFTLERYYEWINNVLQVKYLNVLRASSSEIEGSRVYSVVDLVDENTNTAWVEGKEGSGIGEWVEIIFGDTFTGDFNNNSGYIFTEGREINEIKIINGYAKNKTIYYANNRVKKLKISFDDGTSFKAELDDGIFEPQIIQLPETKKVNDIKLTILDVYKGSKYDDTCISELDFE
jgi:tetratricopeptide (TPR) repeat protein